MDSEPSHIAIEPLGFGSPAPASTPFPDFAAPSPPLSGTSPHPASELFSISPAQLLPPSISTTAISKEPSPQTPHPPPRLAALPTGPNGTLITTNANAKYLQPNFNPASLKVNELRDILQEHRHPTPHKYKKADYVADFDRLIYAPVHGARQIPTPTPGNMATVLPKVEPSLGEMWHSPQTREIIPPAHRQKEIMRKGKVRKGYAGVVDEQQNGDRLKSGSREDFELRNQNPNLFRMPNRAYGAGPFQHGMDGMVMPQLHPQPFNLNFQQSVGVQAEEKEDGDVEMDNNCDGIRGAGGGRFTQLLNELADEVAEGSFDPNANIHAKIEGDRDQQVELLDNSAQLRALQRAIDINTNEVARLITLNNHIYDMFNRNMQRIVLLKSDNTELQTVIDSLDRDLRNLEA